MVLSCNMLCGFATLAAVRGLTASKRETFRPHGKSNRVSFATEKIGDFDAELVETFWQALAANALLNLHLVLHHGSNSHHVAEALFKATARALREAVAVDARQTGVPSSKGTLS